MRGVGLKKTLKSKRILVLQGRFRVNLYRSCITNEVRMTEIYIERSRLHAIADAIAALEPCPFTGTITRDQIVLALGEHGNIWPVSLLEDALCGNQKYSL